MTDAVKIRRRLACLALCGVLGAARAQTNIAASSSGATASPGLVMPPSAPTHTQFFPLAELKRGMRGVAYTVFEGVNPEPMEVEILGLLHDALGPGQDLILARLHGVKPEYTGVVAGMSGSPVYIAGRLVGALSYRIGQFSKEPIAGITPIESMLQVRDGEPATGMRATSARSDGQLEMRPMETPLVLGGFGEETVERFGDRFRAMGLTPVAGLGGEDASAVQPEPLVPGSSVSAVMVRGDLSMAGTCTVTYVDPARLLACGHPITQYGQVDMPMTKAEVLVSLASPLNAFKIINTTETVGAFTEDRASAIMGRFGIRARMIPVEVSMVRASDPAAPRTFHFEVLDNRQLTPTAMLVSIYQSMQANNTTGQEMSYRINGEIRLAGQPTIQLSGLTTETELGPGTVNAALLMNDRFSKVYGNSLEQPVVTGVRLSVEEIGGRRTATLESARLSRTEAHAGDEIELEATLHPYQSQPQLLRLKVKLPANLQPGAMRLLVSDGATLDRLTARTGAEHTLSLAGTVADLNRIHSNDRVYVTLLDHSAQAVVDGGSLASVPLSMANILEPLKDAQKLQLTGESAIEAASADAGYAVSGTQVLNLTIR